MPTITFQFVNPNTPADVADLLEILQSAFKDEFTVNRGAYIASLANPSTIYFILFQGQRVGTFEIKDFDTPPFLASFAILPKVQKQGIGGAVLNQILAIHPDLQAEWADHMQPFYSRFPITRVLTY